MRGTQQISPGKSKKLRDHPVAPTHVAPADIGLRRCAPTHPPRIASRRFAFARHGLAPMASTRPPLAGDLRETTCPPRDRRGAPRRRPCHVGVGFPPLGPRVRICFHSPPVSGTCWTHARAPRATRAERAPETPRQSAPRTWYRTTIRQSRCATGRLFGRASIPRAGYYRRSTLRAPSSRGPTAHGRRETRRRIEPWGTS